MGFSRIGASRQTKTQKTWSVKVRTPCETNVTIVSDRTVAGAGSGRHLDLVNCGVVGKGQVSGSYCLAIPKEGPALSRIFADTPFQRSVWFSAPKQAPANIVIRDKGNRQKVKVGGVTKHCLLIDLDAFERFAGAAECKEQGLSPRLALRRITGLSPFNRVAARQQMSGLPISLMTYLLLLAFVIKQAAAFRAASM